MADNVYEYIWGMVSDYLGDDPTGYFQETGWILEDNDQTFEGDEPFIITIPGAVTVEVSEEQVRQLSEDGVIEFYNKRSKKADFLGPFGALDDILKEYMGSDDFTDEELEELNQLHHRMQQRQLTDSDKRELRDIISNYAQYVDDEEALEELNEIDQSLASKPEDKVSYEAGYKTGYDDAMEDLSKEAQGNTKYVRTHVLNPAVEDPDENYGVAKSKAEAHIDEVVGDSGQVGGAHVVDADRDGYILEVEVLVADEDAFRQAVERGLGAYDSYVSDTPTPELIF